MDMWYRLVDAIADRNFRFITLAVVALLGMTVPLVWFFMDETISP